MSNAATVLLFEGSRHLSKGPFPCPPCEPAYLASRRYFDSALNLFGCHLANTGPVRVSRTVSPAAAPTVER
jgi:hypothetical protein